MTSQSCAPRYRNGFYNLATVAAQVSRNAWRGPFYEAFAERNFGAFLDQLVVFMIIAGCLLVLNVAQAWLREMSKLKTREWLTRDLFGEWLKPDRSVLLTRAGEVGINPDQRIREDARHLTELSADLGIGLQRPADRRTVVLLEVRDGLELWRQHSGQPHQLDIAGGSPVQASDS
jgi:ABC-type uncharacterized transport system fused permease/ATPase subunit